jgi:phosphoglycerate dehydrogenase-like enzyme
MSHKLSSHDATIGVCSRSFGKNEFLKKEIERDYCKVTYYKGSSSLKDQELIDFLQNKSIAILGLEKITKNVLDGCPQLKIICKMGTGTDKIDLNELDKRKIQFYNTPGFNKFAVAELVLIHTLTLARKIKQNMDNIEKKQWKQNLGFELRGKCLGLLGFGAIGQEVARVFFELGCSVVAYDVNSTLIDETEHVSGVTKEELFSTADIVSIHIPLLASTQNFVDESLIYSMKKGSILINTSRGEVVDQAALLGRLQEGDIAAGLDVLHNEPEVDFSLIKLPNVLVTPHIGGSTEEAVARNGQAIIGFLKKFTPVSIEA